MSYETPEVSAELVNTGFVDKVFSPMCKQAEEQASLYIRNKLYEDGILRRLFDHRIVTADELDPNMEDDQPSMIVEIEPDSPGATFVPFKGTSNHEYFHGKRFRVPFGMIESTRESKSKFELMTIRMPITDWLKEHQVKDIQQEEDSAFLAMCNDICAKNAEKQDLGITLGTSTSFKDAFNEGVKAMIRQRLPLGKVMMHANTYRDSLKLKTDEIGFKPQEDRFNRGVDGEDSFLGLPVVTTIKDDLVPENVIYFFTTQEYFCKFFLLQDATLFMKTEGHMIEFHTYEAPGMAIGNTNGVIKLTLQ